MEETVRNLFPDVIPNTQTFQKLCTLYVEGGIAAIDDLKSSYDASDERARNSHELHHG